MSEQGVGSRWSWVLTTLQAGFGVLSAGGAVAASGMAGGALWIASEAEHRAERARLQAEYQECRALEARIEANAQLHLATCLRAQSKAALCRAEAERNTANGMTAGTMLALLAVPFTGGASLAVAAGAMAGGAIGSYSSNTCEAVECPTEKEVWVQAALNDLQLPALPVCVAPEES